MEIKLIYLLELTNESERFFYFNDKMYKETPSGHIVFVRKVAKNVTTDHYFIFDIIIDDKHYLYSGKVWYKSNSTLDFSYNLCPNQYKKKFKKVIKKIDKMLN